jgi:hypothetical protein
MDSSLHQFCLLVGHYKYDYMGCGVSTPGIQNQIFFATKIQKKI